jgi:peptidase E
MTKYILHGGETKVNNESNKDFFFECTNLPQTIVKVVCIYFAKSSGSVEEAFELAKKKFTEAAALDKKLTFVLADENLEILREQIQSADVVYIHGGDTDRLKEKLVGLSDFAQLIAGKTVAGSSAGAYILARYYYSNSKHIISEGFGILPIKVFAHYSEEKQKQRSQLEVFGEELSVYTIPETEFVIIEK